MANFTSASHTCTYEVHINIVYSAHTIHLHHTQAVPCVAQERRRRRTWVEQTLHAGEWRIRLKPEQTVNPDACMASRDFDAWAGLESIAGGSITRKKVLCIEDRPPSLHTMQITAFIKRDAIIRGCAGG